MKEEEKGIFLPTADISLKLTKHAKASIPCVVMGKMEHVHHHPTWYMNLRCSVLQRASTTANCVPGLNSLKHSQVSQLYGAKAIPQAGMRNKWKARPQKEALIRVVCCAQNEVLHNLTLPGYFQGLPVEHAPVIQPQGYKWHHLLKSVKLVL